MIDSRRHPMKATVQARPSVRILAGFVQCLGILTVLVSIINLFYKFAPMYVTVGGLPIGTILYFAGMSGGVKIEVETK